MLKALRDVNLPKFLEQDLPLFDNIIQDLFPGVEKPDSVNKKLMDQVIETCKELNYQPTVGFLAKITQLYDTTIVRHGLMLVGPTGGGKTANYYALAHAQTAIRHEETFERTHYHKLNPKSILQSQMYGDFDPATTEWEDGILAKIMQDCSKDESPDKHWVVFDGPVDAIWIENMNTVLDDNKKLCLNSGQIIQLTERMTMMFEVEDLAAASPATVSRCGMVYMEPNVIGNEALIKSWIIKNCPDTFAKSKKLIPTLDGYFKKYVNEMIKFMRRNVIEPVVTVDNNLVQSLCRILDCYFADYFETEVRKITGEMIEELEESMEKYFCFAVIWSICVTTNADGREKLSKKFRSMMSDKVQFPAEGSIFDYAFNFNKKEW
jgi:dynein heavy chain